MSDIPPLPEGVEKAVLAYGLKSQDFQVRLVDKCDLVTALEDVHRAVAAALLRARAIGVDEGVACESQGQREAARSWAAEQRAEAAAIEAGE